VHWETTVKNFSVDGEYGERISLLSPNTVTEFHRCRQKSFRVVSKNGERISAYSPKTRKEFFVLTEHAKTRGVKLGTAEANNGIEAINTWEAPPAH